MSEGRADRQGLETVDDVSATAADLDATTKSQTYGQYLIGEGSPEERVIEESRLTTIQSVGFSRWYDALKAEGEIWIDTQLKAAPAPAA